LDPQEAIARLASVGASQGSSPDRLREATEAAVEAIVQRFGDRRRTEVDDCAYSIEEVTWPVSLNADGSSSFPHPLPVATLIRNETVLLDVRTRYWDGKFDYDVVGDRIGRWRRFRIGSPGERGYDLRLPTDQDRRAFAGEATAVIQAFGG
jgi:hypothetical protein